jgi:hypothetical protein
MARDRDAADITLGALWRGRSGGTARVLGIDAGYVRYMKDDGAVELVHQWYFRDRYVAPYDAKRCRSQFSMSLANLISFHAFWSPKLKRMFARSSNVDPSDCAAASRGRPALPADAIYIATYSEPATPEQFFEDLNDRTCAGDSAAI